MEGLEEMGFHFDNLAAKDNGVISTSTSKKDVVKIGATAVKDKWSAADMAEFQRIMFSNKNGQNDNNKTTATDLPYEPTAVLNQNQHHGPSQGQYKIRPRAIIDWTGR